MPVRVLLIDDDRRLAEFLSEFLGQNDVVTTAATSGAEGLTLLNHGAFDAVLLDVMMPHMDGLSVLRKLRERWALPVLMLTAKGDETDRVVGLELGADDYLTKPFSPRELLARLRALLRRTQVAASPKLQEGDLQVDTEARQVTLSGRSIDLTGIEFDLLVALLRRSGRVVPRGALLELAGRDDVSVGERAIDVHVSHLRKKLGDGENGRRLIQTVRGVGYVLGKVLA